MRLLIRHFALFLFISCILVLCFYYRWKKAKKQRSNEHSMSVPSFFFQPETPVFLIGADGGSHDKNKRSTTKDKKSQRASTTNSRRVTTSDPNLYSTPVVTGREPKKGGSIRQIYASIGKSALSPYPAGIQRRFNVNITLYGCYER